MGIQSERTTAPALSAAAALLSLFAFTILLGASLIFFVELSGKMPQAPALRVAPNGALSGVLQNAYLGFRMVTPEAAPRGWTDGFSDALSTLR